jgi:hypothetical protein
VTIRRGTEATGDAVLEEKPDAVVVATGALYSPGGRSSFLDVDIPGYDRDFVYRPEDILLDGTRAAGKVVLLDGEGLHTSVGVAEVLALAGADVEYLTAGFAPVAASLVDTQEARFVVQRLRAAGVVFSPSTYLRSIGDHVVTVYDVFTGQERTIERVDAVVLATSRVPVDGLARLLRGKVAQLFTVGDALATRPWRAAAFEGHKFARYIGEPDAPTTVTEAYWQKNPPEVMPKPADVLLGARDMGEA